MLQLKEIDYQQPSHLNLVEISMYFRDPPDRIMLRLTFSPLQRNLILLHILDMSNTNLKEALNKTKTLVTSSHWRCYLILFLPLRSFIIDITFNIQRIKSWSRRFSSWDNGSVSSSEVSCDELSLIVTMSSGLNVMIVFTAASLLFFKGGSSTMSVDTGEIDGKVSVSLWLTDWFDIEFVS